MRLRKGGRTTDRSAAKKFALFHLIAAAGIALFPLYRYVVGFLPDRMTGCILHDWFRIYCPLCGGTRAISALLRFNIPSALRANAFVTLLCFVCLFRYICAWVALLRGKTVLYRFHTWAWIAGAVLLLLFGILRNVLLIRYGIDPLGDLAPFWNGVLGT